MGYMNLTAVFVEAPEGGYIGFVEELPGANTQGETLEECRTNLLEAIQLVLEANRTLVQQHIQGKHAIKEAVVI
jgi:predicted RNase H-like HicB family nuclease